VVREKISRDHAVVAFQLTQEDSSQRNGIAIQNHRMQESFYKYLF
jgi:hypothetical protein